MTSPRTRLSAAFVLTCAALTLAACAGPAEAEPDPTDTAVEVPNEPDTAASEEPDDEAPAAEPTCETIIPEASVADFESLGWSPQVSPFYIGDIEIADGLLCLWADFDAPASDHLQLFGWAEISDDDATRAQESLIAQGWLREEGTDGVYITENPETTISRDEDGYGMTYLFRDGTVEQADTKQGLLLIEWPPAGA